MSSKKKKHRPIKEAIDNSPTFEQRFWNKVNKTPGLGPNGDCHEWIGALSCKDQYGQIAAGSKGNIVIVATRAAYYLHYEVDPGDKFVCHTCDNPKCVRAEHLWLGTNTDNIRDAINKGRFSFIKGEAHRKAKLTEKQAIEILKEVYRPDSRSLRTIAKQYNVAESTIKSLKSGRAWAYLEPLRQKFKNSVGDS